MFRRSTALIIFASMTALISGSFTSAGASVATTANQGAALLHARAGTFGLAVEVPGTAGLNVGANAQVSYVSCASPGNCGAAGFYKDVAGNQQVWVDNQVSGTWGAAVEVPGTAALNVGTTADINGISCPAVGDCTVVGDYTDSSAHLQAFVVDETGGTWGNAQETPGTALLNVTGGGSTFAVSCSSAGNCSAGGTYGDPSGHLQSFTDNEVNGSWGVAIPVPGLAALNLGDSALEWMSCSSPGFCSADGVYTDAASKTQSFVVTETSGTWGTAIETPGDATLNGGGDMEFNTISCSSSGNCAAGGYYTDAATHLQAFVVSETSGVWNSAEELPGIDTFNVGGASAIFTISCTGTGSCGGVGNYTDGSAAQQAFVVDEVAGTWGIMKEAPGSATLNNGGLANLNDVSCSSPGNCAAGGFYSDTSTTGQAFTVNETNGTWGNSVIVPGINTLNADGNAAILSMSCSTNGGCSAGGFYVDNSGNYQAFAVSETFAKAVEKIHLSVVQTTKVIQHALTEVGFKLTATGLGSALGSVDFSSNKGNLCSAKIVKGIAKCTSPKHFAKGTLSVTAKYAGDAFDRASIATSHVVVK